MRSGRARSPTHDDRHSRGLDAGPQIVGRTQEQTLLHELFEGARAGHGRLALLSGEAGIGKTTLVADLGQAAKEQEVPLLIGHCYDLTTTPPYGPWVEIVRATGLDRSQPPLRDLLSEDERFDGARNQMALFEGVVDYLGRLAEHHPLLLVLEDIHWADQASLDLLRFVARQLSQYPILILVNYRDDELTREHPLSRLLPLLVREAAASRIELRRFNEQATRELVTSRCALNEADERRLAGFLHAHAEGNPFFTSELLRSLESGGVVHRANGDWVLAEQLPHQVPTLIRQIIHDRLSRLGSDVRTALDVAAVIGQEPLIDLWRSISGLNDPKFETAIERVQDARLMEETTDGKGFYFSHALVREALYEGLSVLRRRSLHRQIGEALIAIRGSDPDVVANHFQQAGDPRAVEWLIRAGERAQRAYALLLAADRYEAGLRLLERDDPTGLERGQLLLRTAYLLRFADPERALHHARAAEHVASESGEPTLAAYALYGQGVLNLYAGHRRLGIQQMEAGVAAAEALGEGTIDRNPSSDPSSTLFEPDGTLAIALAGGGRFHDAIALAERSLGRSSDTLTNVNLNLALAIAEGCLGRPEQSAQAFDKVHAGLESLGNDHMMKRFTATVHELDYLVWPFWIEQRALRQSLHARAEHAGALADGAMPDEFSYHHMLLMFDIYEGRWAEVERLAASELPPPGQHVRRQMMFSTLAMLARWQGDADRAWHLVHDILPDGAATQPGDHEYRPTQRLFRLAVELALDANDLPTARAWIEACQRWLAWSGAVQGQVETHLLQARWYLATDEIELARMHGHYARNSAQSPRQPLALLLANRFLGEVAIRAGNLEDANAHLGQAMTLADTCAVPFERALTLIALAELRAVSGRLSEARSALDAARNICQQLPSRSALERIDRLADRISRGPPIPVVEYPADLTEREVDVLRLVASGQSNREVADTLSLSVRTVERHISNIYGKIGVQGRSSLTLFALRHHLIDTPDSR